KVLFHINGHTFLREVTDMALAGNHLALLGQEFRNGLRFGGRLNYDQGFGIIHAVFSSRHEALGYNIYWGSQLLSTYTASRFFSFMVRETHNGRPPSPLDSDLRRAPRRRVHHLLSQREAALPL